MSSSPTPTTIDAAPPPPASLRPTLARLRDDPFAGLLVGLAGGVMVASGRRLEGRGRRSMVTVAGLTLMGIAAYRPALSLVRRAGTRRRSAEVRMSFLVRQPVERVFGFCRDFENFPRFVGALRSVHDFGDGRSRWCASTPNGDTIEWNSVTTKYVPNRVIAWETMRGSAVHATGLLRFKPEGGHTCLEVLLTYELVGQGPLRDALAALMAPPRERQLEADIRRLVHYLDCAPNAELEAYGV